MPPTGRLVVNVVDADGRPLDSVERIDVREPYRSMKDALPAPQHGANWLAVPCYSVTASAHYELDRVGLGLQFVVAAQADAIEPVEQTVVGPTRAGETVTVRLVGAARDQIRARLIDENGAPVADRFVELLWMTDLGSGGRQSAGAARSDAEGRVAIPLSRSGRISYRDAVDQWVELVARDGENGRARYEAICPLPKATRLAARDLGDIRVHAAALLVRGSVADDAGAPVPGAEVSVVIPVVLKPGMSYRGPAYGFEPALRATSGPDGTFEIYGDAPVGRLELLAEVSTRHAATPLQRGDRTGFEPGATDVKVVLWRCGTIVGRVVGDPDEIGTLSWHVESERADGARTSGACGFNDRGGSFDDTVPIGRATVEITRRGTPIAKFADLEVKAGAVLRLPPVELAASAHQCELTIVDELGKPVPAGWIASANPDEVRRHEELGKRFPPGFQSWPRRIDVTPFNNGQTTLHSDQELRPFAVGAPGRAAVVVMHPNTAERVVLEPAPKVALQLEYEGDPLLEAISFQVSLAIPADDPAFFRNGPDWMSSDFSSYPRLDQIELARGRPVEIPIRSLGPLAVNLNLGRRQENGYVGAYVEADLKQIEVKRGAAQTFHLRVERVALDAAMRRLNDPNGREPR
jgi:protocatechuate 3,4-dioxygenase beta subunit